YGARVAPSRLNFAEFGTRFGTQVEISIVLASNCTPTVSDPPDEAADRVLFIERFLELHPVELLKERQLLRDGRLGQQEWDHRNVAVDALLEESSQFHELPATQAARTQNDRSRGHRWNRRLDPVLEPTAGGNLLLIDPRVQTVAA